MARIREILRHCWSSHVGTEIQAMRKRKKAIDYLVGKTRAQVVAATTSLDMTIFMERKVRQLLRRTMKYMMIIITLGHGGVLC